MINNNGVYKNLKTLINCLKMNLLALFIMIFAISEIEAQKKYADRLSQMIRTEYEFASTAAESGTRDAFLSFIADDGILFRPAPVNGKRFLINQKKSEGLLSWYPSYAFISKSGDIGCTTGPADFRRDKNSEPLWYGNFATVWKLQDDGKWRFLIDAGNSNGKPESIENKLEPVKSEFTGAGTLSTGVTVKEVIFGIDREFNFILQNSEAIEVYRDYVDDDTRLLRDGIIPVIGLKNITDYLKNENEKFSFEQNDGNISSAGDFGYVYGLMQTAETAGEKIKKYNYFRIWRNTSGKWKILIEVISPLP